MQNWKQSRLGRPRFPALWSVILFVMIGRRDYSDFSFTTLDQKALYRLNW